MMTCHDVYDTNVGVAFIFTEFPGNGKKITDIKGADREVGLVNIT